MSLEAVRAAKDYVITKDVPQTTNEFPWLVTNLVAWRTGGKLIGKSAAQNHWAYQGERYAIDAIAYPESNLEVDCLATAGPPENENRPVWQVNPLKPARYLPPIDPAIIWPPDPIPVPAPIPGPPAPNPNPPRVNLAPVLARLDKIEAALIALAAVMAKPAPIYKGKVLGWPVTLRPE